MFKKNINFFIDIINFMTKLQCVERVYFGGENAENAKGRVYRLRGISEHSEGGGRPRCGGENVAEGKCGWGGGLSFLANKVIKGEN